MTSIDVDHAQPGQDDQSEIEALEEENRSLRAYLARVLEVLEARVTNREHLDHGVDQSTSVQIADLERRLRRTEETIDDLLWMMRPGDHAAQRKAS